MSSLLLDQLKQAASPDLPLAYPASPWQGLYRCSPEDFQVEEDLGFEPEGQGEHLFVWVEKKGCNTLYVAEQLAQRAGLHPRHVSYSGLKDRHAVTRQWFSLHLPGQADPDLKDLAGESWNLLHASRHPRKLKRGVHRGNHFCLRVRIDQTDASTEAWLKERWQQLITLGVPNYFGPQRFGQAGQNLDAAWRWLTSEGQGRKLTRQKKSLWLSSLRSALFNLWLAEQLDKKQWNQAFEGGNYQLEGTRSQFNAEQEDLTELQQRLDSGDLHLTGPLAGKRKNLSRNPAQQKEADFFHHWSQVLDFLSVQGVQEARRGLRFLPLTQAAKPADLSWEAPWLTLRFFLPTGCFATSLLRELIKAEDATHQAINIE